MNKIAIIPTQLALQHFKNSGLRIVHRDPIALLRLARIQQQALKPITA